MQHAVRGINRLRTARDEEPVAVHADSNAESFFNCREILIELAKKPDAVVQAV
ncbi:MAG: hypothetical protein NVSMB31_17810 [Vulcanimicrobiaceae bacterium]